MGNEWRDNIWLIFGLAIVTLAVWLLGLNMWTQISGYLEPRGFDPENVFFAEFKTIPSESPEHSDYGEEENALLLRDRIALLQRIRESKYVEAVGIGNNALPYNFGYYGMQLERRDVPDDSVGFGGNLRIMTPQMAIVLRLNSHEGKTPEQLAAMLAKGNVLIGAGSYSEDAGLKIENLKGHTLAFYGDSTRTFRLGSVIDGIKRSDYEPNWSGTLVIPADEMTHLGLSQVAIRVKPGCGAKFKEEFLSTPEMRRHVNLYISGLTPLTYAGISVNNSSAIKIRSTVLIMVVVILIVIIGLLGTFWFRVHQRTKEIAIRKVCGATASDISRRIIGEGLILVLISTLLAAAIGWPLLKGPLAMDGFLTNSLLILFEAITAIILAAGITLSIWYPARRAMSIEPAIAIKDE